MVGGRDFTWKWSPAKGKSGGLLIGVNLSKLELEDFEVLDFCISMSVRDRVSNFRWLIVTVYGPAHHDRSGDFLRELGQVCEKAVLPIILWVISI